MSGDVEAWLEASGFPVLEIRPLPGDVSLRRYSRLTVRNAGDARTAILATYPPEIRSTCPRFLRTGELLREVGVPVPRVLAASCDDGWMVLEDLGTETLGDWGHGRPWSDLAGWFEQALDLAGRIARIPPQSLDGLSPALDGPLLRKELDQTWDLFLEPRGLTGGAGLTRALRQALDDICAALGAETPVSCHRDFMVRNLMPGAGGLVVLDHQDLRLGPPLYDLASLLNDTIFPPAGAEERLLAAALGAENDRVRYHRAAAQRTLKAVGTYTAFANRGAERHLPLVAPTLERCLHHLALVPESAGIAGSAGGLAAAWSSVVPQRS